jgi:hypothetical protein
MLLNSHFLILESSAWHISRESVEPSLGSNCQNSFWACGLDGGEDNSPNANMNVGVQKKAHCCTTYLWKSHAGLF